MNQPPGVVRAAVLAAGSLLEDLAAFVVANLAFGIALLLAVLAAQLTFAGNLLAVVLALPAAGVMGMATAHIRRGTARLTDFRDGLRRPVRTLILAAIQLLGGFLFSLDALLGWSSGSFPGALFAVASLWILLGLWTYSVVAWTLLLDPAAADRPTRTTLRLAAVVIAWRPTGALGLALGLGLLLGIAVVSVLGILAFAFALACLVAAHWVLPAADALTGARDEGAAT